MDKIGQFHGLGKNSHHLADLLLRSYGFISNISLQIISSFLNLFIEALHSRNSSSLAFNHGISGLKCLNLLQRNVSYRLYTPLSTESHIKIRVSGKKKKYFFRFKARRVDKALSFPSSMEIPLSYFAPGRIYVIVFSVVTSDN